MLRPFVRAFLAAKRQARHSTSQHVAFAQPSWGQQAHAVANSGAAQEPGRKSAPASTPLSCRPSRKPGMHIARTHPAANKMSSLRGLALVVILPAKTVSSACSANSSPGLGIFERVVRYTFVLWWKRLGTWPRGKTHQFPIRPRSFIHNHFMLVWLKIR